MPSRGACSPVVYLSVCARMQACTWCAARLPTGTDRLRCAAACVCCLFVCLSVCLFACMLQLVPYKVVVSFTLLQLVYLLSVWALTTWAGVAGISFPIPIMALVPLRQFVLPRVFDRTHLSQLDAAQYEEAPPVPDKLRAARVSESTRGKTEVSAAHEVTGIAFCPSGHSSCTAGVDEACQRTSILRYASVVPLTHKCCAIMPFDAGVI